jgi:predicted nucleotidyltransferase
VYRLRYMRIERALNPILGSTTKLGLLRTMYRSPDRRWTGRELARSAGLSTAQSARDLGELADTSLLLREVIGRSYVWRLNPSHVLFDALLDLFAREEGLRPELLRDVAEAIPPARPERVRLFGSIARGDAREDSDVDLFLQVRTPVERAGVEEAVGRIRSRIWSRYGNPVSALVYTRAEVERPKNPSLLDSIQRDGVDVSPKDS